MVESPSLRLFFNKTSKTLLVFGLLIGLPYLIPSEAGFRIESLNLSFSAKELRLLEQRTVAGPQTQTIHEQTPLPIMSGTQGDQDSAIVLTQDDGETEKRVEVVKKSPWQNTEVARDDEFAGKIVPIQDPTGHALDGFSASLKRVQNKENAVTRVVYYGDSTILPDWTTGSLRRRFQQQFGDAGHGYVVAVSAWRDYHHDDIYRSTSDLWQKESAVPGNNDGIVGLGGVSATGQGAGLSISVGTTTKGIVGRTVQRFRINYVEQKSGGKFDVTIDDNEPQLIDTKNTESTVVKRHLIETTDGPHRLRIHTAGNGLVRLLGIDLERNGPGVIVDSLALGGGRFRALLQWDENHWRDELELRNPALVVFAFGANESGIRFNDENGDYLMTGRQVIARFRKALPNTSCLFVSGYDRGSPQGVPDANYPTLIEAQKTLAFEARCGFINIFEAMGGTGSMARWVRMGLGAGDFLHPTARGADIVANWIGDALLRKVSE